MDFCLLFHLNVEFVLVKNCFFDLLDSNDATTASLDSLEHFSKLTLAYLLEEFKIINTITHLGLVWLFWLNLVDVTRVWA